MAALFQTSGACIPFKHLQEKTGRRCRVCNTTLCTACEADCMDCGALRCKPCHAMNEQEYVIPHACFVCGTTAESKDKMLVVPLEGKFGRLCSTCTQTQCGRGGGTEHRAALAGTCCRCGKSVCDACSKECGICCKIHCRYCTLAPNRCAAIMRAEKA